MPQADQQKHPGGRPTLYKESYCNEVIQHMADGYSLDSFAGLIGVSAQTCYNWQNEIPEFFEAIRIGRAKAAKVWEERLTNLAITNQGNATATIFALKNRFPDTWRDKQEHEHSGPNGGPIQTQSIDLSALSPEELEQWKALLMKVSGK